MRDEVGYIDAQTTKRRQIKSLKCITADEAKNHELMYVHTYIHTNEQDTAICRGRFATKNQQTLPDEYSAEAITAVVEKLAQGIGGVGATGLLTVNGI